MIRRVYQVYIGRIGKKEIDFVAINELGEEYYQVSETVREKKTLERELSSLDNRKNHYPKFLITLDFSPYTSLNGIKQINALEWF